MLTREDQTAIKLRLPHNLEQGGILTDEGAGG